MGAVRMDELVQHRFFSILHTTNFSMIQTDRMNKEMRKLNYLSYSVSGGNTEKLSFLTKACYLG